MTYELAKKLKDAGFHHEWCAEHVLQDCDGKHGGYPTLEELIEACVPKNQDYHRDFGLWFSKHNEPLGKRVWRTRYFNGGNSKEYICTGSNPEEAVANLWLELHKNDVR